MPMFVAEFGITSSRGAARIVAHGRGQGFHTEKGQGQAVEGLINDIYMEGFAGGEYHCF